ncbi:MBL fold metallo-hydrolase [Belnapia sp. T6]|uniref:MBL fold metallo-hydrolase n=1 Tax=Belnapia mucosa TaxID=2804532 RepID=A0ABS1V177_9PROT|nr:MBL fold metallo-hydrolase [Belnapia mucosa]MBL6454429.1 MBL fold metallo-hydrolase [Belnapia mucosa]
MLKAAILPVTPFQQNCGLFWDEATGAGCVIDPGGEVERILGAIAELKISIGSILLTHGHIDHAGGAAELKEALPGTPPVIGPDRRDAFLLEGLAQQGAQYGFPARDLVPDRWLEEGDSVEIGGESFEVLHCPGHTPGHLCFVNTTLRVAVVGDVLFRGSVGRTDFPYGDHAALLAAIHGKLLPLGDDISFLCGHGPGSTFGHERQRNPFLRDQ